MELIQKLKVVAFVVIPSLCIIYLTDKYMSTLTSIFNLSPFSLGVIVAIALTCIIVKYTDWLIKKGLL